MRLPLNLSFTAAITQSSYAHTILASITLCRATVKFSTVKRRICELRRVQAAAAELVPATASAAKAAANTVSELSKLVAPGLSLQLRGRNHPAWHPGMEGPVPEEIKARFLLRVSAPGLETTVKSIRFTLGPLGDVIAAANRIARSCHAAMAADPDEPHVIIKQKIVAAVKEGTFKILMTEYYEHALAAVQAER